MKLIPALVLLLCLIGAALAEKRIPEKFFGKFELERSENFDEFLAAKGINWFVRKFIEMQSVTKEFRPSAQPHRYDYSSQSGGDSISYQSFQLGVEFSGKGFDKTIHKITFDVADDLETVTERHIRPAGADGIESEETYYYTIEGDYLVLTLRNYGITAKRFMKRQNN